MFLSLTMSNFRDFSEYTLQIGAEGGRSARLRGRNGAGKSSVREALCFALTGRDSFGGSAPTHLIKIGCEKASVTLHTPLWEISRTLTRKKNSTLKIRRSRSGVFAEITQTTLSKLFSLSEEMILSAISPGFFMQLAPQKRMKLFSEITPDLDRMKLLAQMSGQPEGWIKKLLGDVNEKMPRAELIAEKRRDVEKKIAHFQGKIESCLEDRDAVLVKPVASPELLADYDKVAAYFDMKTRYQVAILNYSRIKSLIDSITNENRKKLVAQEELIKEMSSLSYKPLPEAPNWYRYQALKNLIRPYPKKPTTTALPEGDYCTACGQAVSISYREKVTQTKESSEKSYLQEYQIVDEHNHQIQVEMDRLYSELMSIERERTKVELENKNIESEKRSIEKRLLAFTPITTPDEPEEPRYPTPPFDEITMKEVSGTYKRYCEDNLVYERLSKRKVVSEAHLFNAQKDVEKLSAELPALQSLEDALKHLYQREAEIKQDMFSFDVRGLHIEMEEGFEVVNGAGVPYNFMSAGERLRVDVEVSLKLYAFLLDRNDKADLPFYPFIFVDNTDLADWTASIVYPDFLRKIIYAEVDPERDFTVEEC